MPLWPVLTPCWILIVYSAFQPKTMCNTFVARLEIYVYTHRIYSVAGFRGAQLERERES